MLRKNIKEANNGGEGDYDGTINTLNSIQEICRHKNKEKKNSACKRVNYFLAHHFEAKNFKKKITKFNEITYEFLNEEDECFDVLATFFATIARVRCNEANPLVSMNSADGFFHLSKCFVWRILKSKNLKNYLALLRENGKG